MFTGIIEETGTVKEFKKNANSAELVITCSKVLENTKIGDSISINGVCQTVVKMNESDFTVNVSKETLSITTFLNLRFGDTVNLERALALNERLGGHVVSGHVDSKAKCIFIKKESDFYTMKFEIANEVVQYVVKKGSITINGISLTVADIQDKIITIAIIPHTFENTNLNLLKIGESVNIETDIFAKYIEKILLNKSTKSIISKSFLEENGFI